MKKLNIALIAAALLIIPIAFSQTGLEKIQEYNQQQAIFYLQNLTFFVAFLGGMISVLLPCTLAILPAFFAYTFKEKKEITKMTLVFFAGFSSIFIILGILASVLGKSLTALQVADTKLLILIAGVFLILFGIMTMLGLGFNFLNIGKNTGHDIVGTFTFGIFFGLGWSACLGPILAAILLVAATFQNYFYAGMLLFAYSLGLFVPLFLISILFDKYNLTQKPFIKGKEFEIKIFGKSFFVHTTKVIAGLLLVGTGYLFIAYNGTSVINSLDPLRSSIYAYKIEGSIFSLPAIDFIGIITLVLFVGIVGYFLYGRKKEEKKEEKQE